jgi:hypothetical protein
MRRRAFMTLAVLGIAASSVSLAVTPAFSEPATHTITITDHNLASLQPGGNHLLQDSELEQHGHTIGYSTSTCALDVSTRVITCDVAASFLPGILDVHAHINTTNGAVHGTVTGGTGTYRHATGTVTGQPSTSQPGDIDLTIVYRTH